MFDPIARRARRVALIGLSAALAVGGVAVAQNDSGGGEGQDRSGKAGKRQGKRMGGHGPGRGPLGNLMGRSLTYAELHVMRNGEPVTIRVDSGRVVAAGAGQIKVEENDGNEVTIAVDDETRVLAGPGRSADVTDLRTGQRVIVTAPEGEAADTVATPPRGGKGQARRGQGQGQGQGKQGRLPPPMQG